MSREFKATEKFWQQFYALPNAQKASTRAKWEIFKKDPWDSRLGTHKHWGASARLGRPVWIVDVEYDLRVFFVVDGDIVTTLGIGPHSKMYGT